MENSSSFEENIDLVAPNVIDLDAARERRYDTRLAHYDVTWHQIGELLALLQSNSMILLRRSSEEIAAGLAR